MNEENYLHINDNELDRYAYRIISLERLYELFVTHQNVLVRPSMWDDPFENFILKSKVRMPDGSEGEIGFDDSYYGQCWTLTSVSDAMWRIYSPDTKGVRIRTTIRKLANSLGQGLGEWAHVQAFVGRVRYLKDKELLDFANKVFAKGLSVPALAETFLVKRTAFQHEKEIRILYSVNENRPVGNLFRCKIDPHDLIDQVMIDPRLPLNEVNDLKVTIKRKTGFLGKLKRSKLYAPPDDFVFPIGS